MGRARGTYRGKEKYTQGFCEETCKREAACTIDLVLRALRGM